jgi:hypothetical protein
MLYKDSDLVQAALSRYYEMNALPADGGITDKWAKYKIGPFNLIGFPNFAHRMQAIRRHDVHHIVNNLDTSALGEGLIAAWELGSGCGKYWISWCMEPQALWWGILMAPRKTFSLFVLGRHSQNFFHINFENEFLNKTVGDLRKALLPENATSLKTSIKDYFVFAACSLLGIFMIIIFIPIFTIFSLFGLLKGQK